MNSLTGRTTVMADWTTVGWIMAFSFISQGSRPTSESILFQFNSTMKYNRHLYNTDQNARSIIIVASLTSIFYGLSFIVTDSFKAGR